MIDNEERTEVPQTGLLADIVQPGMNLIAVFAELADQPEVAKGATVPSASKETNTLLMQNQQMAERIRQLEEKVRLHEEELRMRE
jgi:hypothetical protein